VDLGNIVHSGDANGIVVITQVQPIDAIYTVAENNLPTLMQLMSTMQDSSQTMPDVVAYDRDDKVALANGRLLAVDNQVDTTTGTVKLKARFDNSDNKLFANQFVNIHMVLQTVQNALLVPTAAVQRGTQGSFVFVVGADKTVQQRTVTTGPAQGQMTSVQSGLQPGETVVVDGLDRLKDGGKVMVAGTETTSGTIISGTQPIAVSDSTSASGTHSWRHRRDGAAAE
jgi:multidrug efflux system membrane fusion protein